MYRTDLNNRDKGGAIAGVVAIHAGIAFALLHLSGQVTVHELQHPLSVFDITEDIPPPPPPPPEQAQQPKPKKEEGGSAPNIKSEATPIVAPKPRIPIKSPVAVSETPAQGTAPTQGAAPVRGAGTGSGGTGTGTGGGSGAGSGGGGGGGVATQPRIIRGIVGRDYPPQIQSRWPRGGAIFLRLRIEPNGRPSQCDVMRSYGDSVADQWTCSLIMERGVFRPATNMRGQPVAAWYGYVQRERDR